MMDLRMEVEGRRIRLTDSTDDETARFEEELTRSVDLALVQTQAYLKSTRREFKLLQIRTADGRAAMQAVIYVNRPKRFKGLGKALVPKMGRAIDSLEESFALRMLKNACSNASDLISLRLQPLRLLPGELEAFEAHAIQAGFKSCVSVEYTKTLKLDLTPSSDELLAGWSKKTRAKIRHRSRNEVVIKPLTDPRYIPQCVAAQRASFERSGGEANDFDFEAVFELARSHPQRVHILGLFLPSEPDRLSAFVVGYRYGKMTEYVSAGSLSDPVLRRMPFNYFLIWDLIEWAKNHGSEWMDLGGISGGNDADPTARISEFKRHLSEDEIEIGREMAIDLKPMQAFAFEALNGFRRLLRLPSSRLAGGIGAALGLAALMSLGMCKIGDPESPAWKALRKQSQMPAIAVIGDSRAHVGISPTVIRDTLKREGLPLLDAHNFAVDGTDAAHHFSFASHGLLQSGRAPRVILWAANPLAFNGYRSSNRLEQLLARDIIPLFSAGAPFETLLDLATMSIFAPYRYRPLTLQRIFDDYGGRAAIRTLPIQTRLLGLERVNEPNSREYHERPDGQAPFDILAWDDRFKRGADAYVVDYEKLQLSEWRFQLAKELMRSAKQAGALLVVIETPVAPFYQEKLATLSKHREWRSRMQSLAQQEGALFWIDASLYGDDRLFGDPGHMPEKVAREYSEHLAKKLAADETARTALKDRGTF